MEKYKILANISKIMRARPKKHRDMGCEYTMFLPGFLFDLFYIFQEPEVI